jgi:glycosyltransferase involved in cell wall biosynthesis
MQTDHASKCGGKQSRGILAATSTDRPLVSVVTVIYNGYPYVQGCLESVFRQDYPNIEYIVIDGGSTDNTLDVLRRYDDRLALWKSEPDHGVYDAWNKGLREAHGEWICFLGVDDEFLPGAVSAYMALAAKHPKAEYLSSRVKWEHPSGYVRIIGSPWSWNRFRQVMCTAHVGSMHRRSLFDRLGYYDISYSSAADYELLLRARGRLNAAFMPAVTVMMRAGGVSDDTTALAEAKRAKIATGGRNRILAELEFQLAKLKFAFRPLHRALGRAPSGD